MKTVTMRHFNRELAWNRRFDIPVKVGTKLLLDQIDRFEISDVDMPEDMEHNCPWYTLRPIGKTLERYKRDHDNRAKVNLFMTAGQYPDFSFRVESAWFFSRDVRWDKT